jgi:hypothetical protein
LLLLPACERRDSQFERKFQFLVEENARLVNAVGGLPDGPPIAPFAAARPSPENGRALTAENERLREFLARHEREVALGKNRSQREAIEREVVAIRGLPFKTPVDYRVLNRAEIRQTITGKLGEVFSEEELRHLSAALAALGLLPENFPLREKYIELLSEQVAAFYDQHQHKLFMYEDASLESSQNRVVLAHELTHALQDQHFGLSRLPLELKTNDDRAAAASALVEGDATLVMTEFTFKNLSLGAIKDSLGTALTQNMQQLQTAPRYLREMLVFPYLRGQEFCAALTARGGFAAVSRAYADPPSSTAQILHPEKYLADPREEPQAIEWPDPTAQGQKAIADNTVGEMGIRLLFTEWLDGVTAERASVGWRGDRYLAFDQGRALVWKTVWDTEGDAEEFFEAERRLLEKRYRPEAPSATGREYDADRPRFLRLRRTEANEVLLIDVATPEWGRALTERF